MSRYTLCRPVKNISKQVERMVFSKFIIQDGCLLVFRTQRTNAVAWSFSINAQIKSWPTLENKPCIWSSSVYFLRSFRVFSLLHSELHCEMRGLRFVRYYCYSPRDPVQIPTRLHFRRRKRRERLCRQFDENAAAPHAYAFTCITVVYYDFRTRRLVGVYLCIARQTQQSQPSTRFRRSRDVSRLLL